MNNAYLKWVVSGWGNEKSTVWRMWHRTILGRTTAIVYQGTLDWIMPCPRIYSQHDIYIQQFVYIVNGVNKLKL